ncbi:MAG: class I SAM-dependent RNA methyltransferase [Leptospira sp.]|nr:class I SAM-dependent RNA methyltransferase [Leptospira sp.]NCS93210.1 class I SAM-dependent RNA methyltransferase [Leptospira sp.]
MNVGDILELTPEKWVDKGYTIAHHLGRVVFLRAGIPNRKGRFTIEKLTSKLIFASDYSIKSDCEVFSKCGGCSYRHISYEEEITLKTNELSKSLSIELDTIEVIKADPEGYRNNVQWKISQKNIGLYKSFSNEIVNLRQIGCKNLDPSLKYPPINILNSNLKDLKIRLSNSIPIDYAKEETILEIGKFQIRIPRNGFMQTNQFLIKPWLEKIKSFLPENQTNHILEFYCGAGLIGIYGKDKISSLEGFEMVESSIQYARKNAKANKVELYEYKTVDLGKMSPKIVKGKQNIWIMNPPRAGLSEKLRAMISHFKPKEIIYSSCDAMTLARDLRFIRNFNSEYNLEKTVLFDFFPRTPHYEVLIHLKKK